MNKKILLIVPIIILIALAGICTVILSTKTTTITCEKAEAKLLEYLSDDPDINAMYVEHENVSNVIENISVKDRQGFLSKSVYCFSLRYNDNMPGLEDCLAADYAVSSDGKLIYWYDPANDWYIDCADLDKYNMATGEWVD